MVRKRNRSSFDENVKNKIHVFISSSQDEFEDLRGELRDQLNNFRIARKKLFDSILVESGKSQTFKEDIDKGLDAAAIYVVIIGNIDSPTTLDEFKDAWVRGIPVLAYDFRMTSRNKGNKTELEKYFENLRKQSFRVDRPIERKPTRQQLITQVILDVIEKTGEIVSNYVKIRGRIVHKGKLGVVEVEV